MTETIRFTYIVDDMHAALRAHYHAVRPPLVKTIGFVLLVALGASLLKSAVDDELDLLQVAQTAGIIALVLGILIAPLRWIGLRSVAAGAARNFALQQELQSEITVGFDDAEMTWNTAYGQSHRPYAIIPFWYEHDDMILIYQSETTYFVIPAAAFTDAGQRQRLVKNLRAAGVKERT